MGSPESASNVIGANHDCINRRRFLASSGAAAATMASGFGLGTPTPAATNFDYTHHDAVGLAELVRKKEVSAEELLDAAIARIKRLNPNLNAVVESMYDEARRSVIEGLPDGPFTGVPFLLKPIAISAVGARITSGSRLFADNVGQFDTELVKRYKRAGLVITGLTNVPEFGLVGSTESVHYGPAHNPWDMERTTGGSSGGAAAAVASRMVPIAHANDGGGSIRIPASCCGVFGLKPSRGRTPMGPLVDEAIEGMGCQHAVSITVRDSAAMLDATSAPEVGAPYGIPTPERPYLSEVGRNPGKLRIAVNTTGPFAQTHPDCRAAVKDVAELCEELGHQVEERAPQIEYEPLYEAVAAVFRVWVSAGLSSAPLPKNKQLVDLVEPWTYRFVEKGKTYSAVDYVNLRRTYNTATRQMGRFLSEYDILLTPCLTAPPRKLGYFDTSAPDDLAVKVKAENQFLWIANVAGVPAMSVPLVWDRQGLPIGVQFIGRYADEATLFRLAGQLEQARPWRGRLPTAS